MAVSPEDMRRKVQEEDARKTADRTPRKLSPSELFKSWADDDKTVTLLTVFHGHELTLVPSDSTLVEVDGKLSRQVKKGLTLTFQKHQCKVPLAIANHMRASRYYKQDYAVREELNEASRKGESWAERFVENMAQRAEAAGRKLQIRKEVQI